MNSEARSDWRGADARRLLRHIRTGVLATHSLKLPGYPYGAALPCCTDQQGRIIVLISHLAEHTQNIEHDQRVSFTVSPMGPDLQQHARATVVGDAVPADDAKTAARHLRFFPEGRDYLSIGGFRFFAIEPRQVRFIAGFGSLHWLSGATVLAPDLPIAHAEAEIIAHMTGEHGQNLRDYCRHVYGIEANAAEMVGIDCDGFDVRAAGSVLRFDFATEIRDAQSARAALVEMARAARG